MNCWPAWGWNPRVRAERLGPDEMLRLCEAVRAATVLRQNPLPFVAANSCRLFAKLRMADGNGCACTLAATV